MIQIRYAETKDREFWYRLDAHLPAEEFEEKVRTRRGYVLLLDGRPVGILRYNLFWDNTPFCTMLYIAPDFRGMGLGKALMLHWEADMRRRGFAMLMTSTQSDEDAQHFYRKLGYRDCGGFVVNIPGFEQPLELLFIKENRGGE